MIRLAALFTLFVFIGSVSHPDEPKAPALQLTQPGLGTSRAARGLHIRRNVGIVLTVVGTLFTVFGSLGACYGDASCRGVYGNTSWASDLTATVFVVAGQSMIVPGIILWANGQKKSDDAEKKALSLTTGGVRLTF